MSIKSDIQAKFKELYPKKRLLAVQLNGFTHSVFIDSGMSSDKVVIERYSAYTSGEGFTKEAKELVGSYPHDKHNPTEYVYVTPRNR